MAGVASAVGLWNKPSKEEIERDAVCKAFVKILEYMDREVDKNMDGKVSIEDLTVYIADCGIKLNDENVGEMEKFASEDRMFNKTSIQHYAVKCGLFETYVANSKELTKEITKAETLWEMMDKNQDGVISRAEYGETLANLSERQVKFLFAKYDKDSNRRISKEEFSAMMEDWKNKKKNKAK